MMGSTQRVLGSIVSLWRYPVKSMMGEELNAADITKRGLLGDRAYALVGQTLGIGDALRLSVDAPCPRCVMTTLPQADLPKDSGILRSAAQHNRANVGVYASVLQAGKVRRGDSIRLE